MKMEQSIINLHDREAPELADTLAPLLLSIMPIRSMFHQIARKPPRISPVNLRIKQTIPPLQNRQASQLALRR